MIDPGLTPGHFNVLILFLLAKLCGTIMSVILLSTSISSYHAHPDVVQRERGGERVEKIRNANRSYYIIYTSSIQVARSTTSSTSTGGRDNDRIGNTVAICSTPKHSR